MPLVSHKYSQAPFYLSTPEASFLQIGKFKIKEKHLRTFSNYLLLITQTLSCSADLSLCVPGSEGASVGIVSNRRKRKGAWTWWTRIYPGPTPREMLLSWQDSRRRGQGRIEQNLIELHFRGVSSSESPSTHGVGQKSVPLVIKAIKA